VEHPKRGLLTKDTARTKREEMRNSRRVKACLFRWSVHLPFSVFLRGKDPANDAAKLGACGDLGPTEKGSVNKRESAENKREHFDGHFFCFRFEKCGVYSDL
jgi:hypothetical protein